MGSAASSSLKSAAASATDSCLSICHLLAVLASESFFCAKDQELAAALSQLDKADLQKLKSAVSGGQRVVVEPWPALKKVEQGASL